MGEMEVALQEVRGTLEGARSEIESLRGEAGVCGISPHMIEGGVNGEKRMTGTDDS
jgi:hypothetical protein